MAKAKEKKAVDFTEGESLVVDFDSVEEATGFEVLPRGMYPCQIVECEFTYAQSSGNPMWTCTLELIDGDFAGRKLFTHMVFAGAGLSYTKRMLTRIAPDLIENAIDPSDADIYQQLIGRECQAKVSIRKYQDEDRNNVQDLFAAKEGDSFL